MNFMANMFGGGSRGGMPIGANPNGQQPQGGSQGGQPQGGTPNQNQQPQVVNQGAANNGVIPPNSNQQNLNAPQGGMPNSGGQQGQGGTPNGQSNNPLDTFTPFFNTDSKSGDNKQPELFDPYFTDEHFTNLQQNIAQQSFANVTPEVMQKIMSGDTSAFAGVINQAIQSAFMMSTRLNNSMMSESIKTYHGRYQPELDTKFNTYHGQQTLNSQHPALQHPAMRPMVDALRAQFSQASPNDTPTQINDKIVAYLKQSAGLFNGDNQGVGNDPIGGNSRQQPQQKQDWNSWFSQNGRR